MQSRPSSETLTAGLLVGGVYRFQISGIPGAEGAELFPTIEVIDRTYPPPGLATPISRYKSCSTRGLQGGPQRPIGDQGDLPGGSANGDPHSADAQKPIDHLKFAEYQDALEVADQLGRPVAIVRIGSVAPPSSPALLPQFFFGYPVWAPIVQPEPITAQSEPVTQP